MLLDLSHTSHTRALTGIQRVARGLWAELGAQAEPICFDPHARAWRGLRASERASLAAAPAGGKRRAVWPLGSRLAGIAGRILSRPPRCLVRGGADGLLVPEIFSPGAAAALPALFGAVPGPRAALFYDAVALKCPELTPAGTVARYPGYLRELEVFDGIAAISADARDALLGYWDWLGVRNHPGVAAITLGVRRPPAISSADRPGTVILSVGTIEGRKNHAALLDACAALWDRGARFELRLIGAARPETGGAALERIASLRARGRPVRHDGVVDDAALEAAYAGCAFTVYPSLMEGFGLPVAESLVRGRACICSGRGALGESARGGGCIALDSVDAASLAGAIGSLIGDKPLRERLEAEARARRFKTPADYAREIREWMATLPGRERPISDS